MKHGISLFPYAKFGCATTERPAKHDGTDATAGEIYWKGQPTTLQGDRDDFEAIVVAIFTRSSYEQKWCAVRYFDGVVLIGSRQIMYEPDAAALVLPYEVALVFATELGALAGRMKRADPEGRLLVDQLDQAVLTAEALGVERCACGDVANVRGRLVRDPRSAFYRASAHDARLSKAEIEHVRTALMRACEKQRHYLDQYKATP